MDWKPTKAQRVILGIGAMGFALGTLASVDNFASGGNGPFWPFVGFIVTAVLAVA